MQVMDGEEREREREREGERERERKREREREGESEGGVMKPVQNFTKKCLILRMLTCRNRKYHVEQKVIDQNEHGVNA